MWNYLKESLNCDVSLAPAPFRFPLNPSSHWFAGALLYHSDCLAWIFYFCVILPLTQHPLLPIVQPSSCDPHGWDTLSYRLPPRLAPQTDGFCRATLPPSGFKHFFFLNQENVLGNSVDRFESQLSQPVPLVLGVFGRSCVHLKPC